MKRNVSVVRFKFRFNILISGKIIKEMPVSVASETLCIFLILVSFVDSVSCETPFRIEYTNKRKIFCIIGRKKNSNISAELKIAMYVITLT